MRRRYPPYKGRRFLIDINPLSKTIHDLDNEKKSCNLNKIIEPHIKMFDTMSQVNQYRLLNPGYKFCTACFKANNLNENL